MLKKEMEIKVVRIVFIFVPDKSRWNLCMKIRAIWGPQISLDPISASASAICIARACAITRLQYLEKQQSALNTF